MTQSRLLPLLPVAVAVGLLSVPAGAATEAQGGSPQIRWTTCPREAYPAPELADALYPQLQCGTFRVPYDYDRPNGKKFTLALQKLPALGTKVGTLFTNPGGPGASGRNTWVLPATSPSLRRSFDLVGFDPRGVGATTPAFDCDPAAGEPPNTPDVNWVRFAEEQASRTARANRACQRKSADFIAHVGTNNVVRDLDAMRAAVGDPQLTYWGMSYGTRIGYVYAYRYPKKVRAILLDGPVTPDGSWANFADVRSISNDEALRFIRAVSPATYAAIISTRNSLFASRLGIGTPGHRMRMGGYDWLSLISSRLLLQQANWPQITKLADVVATARIVGSGGDDARAHLRRLFGGAGAAVGSLPGLAPDGGANSAINCADYADRPSARRRARIVRNVVSQAPVFGGSTAAGAVSACVGYTFRPDPVPKIASQASLARVANLRLAISDSTADAATPLVWGRAMTRAFPSSFEVTQRTGNHVNFLSTESNCVDDPLREYLLTRTMAPRRTMCLFTAPAGLDMAAVAASRHEVDPRAVADTILRNNRLRGQ